MHKEAAYLLVSCLLGWVVVAEGNTTTTPVAQKQPAIQSATVPKSTQEVTQYVVQVGAFADEFQAVYWRRHLLELNIASFILPAKPNQSVLKIRTGPYASKQEAEQMALYLKLHGVADAMVLPQTNQP